MDQITRSADDMRTKDTDQASLTPKKSITRLQVKSAKTYQKPEEDDDSDDSLIDTNNKPKVTESMADFFRNTGPTNDASNMKQKSNPQATLKHPGSLNELSSKVSPAKSNKGAIILDSDDEDEPKIKKESSMAEFLANTSPADYMVKAAPTLPTKKSFFGFGSSNSVNENSKSSANTKKESSKNLFDRPSSAINSTTTSKTSLIEGQNASQSSLSTQNIVNDKKKVVKQSPLSKESPKLAVSDDTINKVVKELISTSANQISSEDQQLQVNDHQSDVTSQADSAYRYLASLKAPSSRMSTSPPPKVPSINAATASSNMYTKNHATYLSADSFAALPAFGSKEVSKPTASSPTATVVRTPPTLLPLPLPTLVLSKAVKELTVVDKEYRKVFVAPSEQELPALAKKVKVFISFGCQTNEEHGSDFKTDTNDLRMTEVDDKSNQVLVTGSKAEIEEDHAIINSRSNILNSASGVLSTEKSLELEMEPSTPMRIGVELTEFPVISEVFESRNGIMILKDDDQEVLIKESEAAAQPVIGSDQNLLDTIEKLTQENECLRIDLSKEKEKREKVDVDRKVMHYQYDKLIRLTHRKVVEGVNAVRQLEYEIELLKDKLKILT